jgi:preprotein translocase subunit SecB
MNERISFEMIKLKLIRSVYLQNVDLPPPSPGGLIAMGLSLKNGGEFIEDGMKANFLQSFKTHGGPNMPFSLEADFAAVFSMSRPVTERERDHYLNRAFPQAIFPYTREYVAETTRRGGFPPLLINMNLFPDEGAKTAGAAAAPPGDRKWLH